MKSIIIISIIGVVAVSCTFDNKEDYFKGYVCDTTHVNYDEVNTILQENCVSCHKKDLNNRGIILDNYEGVVAAEDSDLLYKAVNHIPGNGIRITPMPYGLNKLPACPISKINTWIRQGMPR